MDIYEREKFRREKFFSGLPPTLKEIDPLRLRLALS